MSAPVDGDRALRYTRRTTKRVWQTIVAWIVLTPLLSWLALAGTKLGTGTGVTIVAGVLAVPTFGPQLFTYLRVRALRLAGDRLVRGGKSCELTASWDIDLAVVNGRAGQRLVLRAEDLRVVLGSSSIPSFFEPDDVRRLARILARSEHPGPREIAEHLTWLANDPGLGAWPRPKRAS